jgi:hypothetical protein
VTTSGTDTAEAKAATRLIESLCDGDIDGVRALYAGVADIDDPFAGHQVDGGFERLATGWRPVQGATVTALETTHSTAADGFVATEITLRLERAGEPVTLGIVVVNELAEHGKVDKTRLYYRRAHIDGRQHYRDRMLDTEIEVRFPPVLDRYQKALRARDVGPFLETFAEDGYFDGHGGAQDLAEHLGMGRYEGHQQLRGAITQMMELGREESPKGRLEHVNHFHDGRTHVLEFNILKPEISRIHAGVACYELTADGTKLQAARVYDEAW